MPEEYKIFFLVILIFLLAVLLMVICDERKVYTAVQEPAIGDIVWNEYYKKVFVYSSKGRWEELVTNIDSINEDKFNLLYAKFTLPIKRA